MLSPKFFRYGKHHNLKTCSYKEDKSVHICDAVRVATEDVKEMFRDYYSKAIIYSMEYKSRCLMKGN